jgi:hypothetical protein
VDADAAVVATALVDADPAVVAGAADDEEAAVVAAPVEELLSLSDPHEANSSAAPRASASTGCLRAFIRFSSLSGVHGTGAVNDTRWVDGRALYRMMTNLVNFRGQSGPVLRLRFVMISICQTRAGIEDG